MENCINTLSACKEESKNRKQIKKIEEKSSMKRSFENILNEAKKGKFKDIKEALIEKEKEPEENVPISKRITQDRIDGAVNKLASFFKMGPNLLLTILNSLGIKPEDLVDESKRDYVINKLSKYFMLSRKKREDLEELLANF